MEKSVLSLREVTMGFSTLFGKAGVNLKLQINVISPDNIQIVGKVSFTPPP